MKKKTDYSNEMEYIKDWCITVIDFKMEMSKATNDIRKIYEPLKESLKKNYNSKNKNIQRGFKETYRIMNEEVSNWTDAVKIDLNNILLSKFGTSLIQEDNSKLQNIIEKGEISNDNEFNIISKKVNEICQINPKSNELGKLNHILLLYEQSNKNKI